jgi:signal transduction histidine kinase
MRERAGAHRGEVRIESSNGGGTIVRVRLPMEQLPARNPAR